MKIALQNLVIMLALGLSACQDNVEVTVSAGGNSAALTDPGLLAAVPYIVGLAFYNQGGQNRCNDLLASSVDDLQSRNPFGEAAFTPDSPRGAVFGAVPAGGQHSILLLGTTEELELRDAPLSFLEQARGSIIAGGCEELVLTQDEREKISITLFPTGLR